MTFHAATTRELVVKTTSLFTFGAVLFAIGYNGMYENVAPMQAKIKARNNWARKELNKKYGYEKFKLEE